MSSCRCSEAKRPLAPDLPANSNKRPRQWFVTRRNENCSAFNGYRRDWSAYSDVSCRVCGAHWRTKAAYVSSLRSCDFWPNHAPRVEAIDD